MTVDYKETLLDYISGDLTVGSQTTNEFRGNEQITNNIIQTIKTALGKNDIGYHARILITDTTSNYLMYGTYIDEWVGQAFTERSYIAVLDQSGTVLSVIDSYSSGTKFGIFQSLKYDDEGNIYGVDYYNGKYRVILLNNVAVESSSGFICKLRNSYYISDDTFETPKPFGYLSTRIIGDSCIKKDTNDNSTYYIVGRQPTESSYVFCLCKFTINVGSTNDWEYYTGVDIGNSNDLTGVDILLQQSGDDTIADIYYVTANTPTVLSHEYFDSSALISKTSIQITDDILDFRILDEDTIFVTSNIITPTCTVYFYRVDGTSLTLLNQTTISYSFPDPQTALIPRDNIEIINGLVFTKLTCGISLTQYQAICGVYDGENYIQSPAYTLTMSNYLDTSCAVLKTYSLYKYIVQDAVDLYRPYIVIYDNQYSGGSYVSYNSLTPLHSEIYSNSSLVFARGLYNKQVYQNMCVSTVNIPNNYLNGIPLMPSKLLGTTMLELVNNTDTITKNVYENLFINFNNKIQVIDEDNSNLYPETANYINTSVSYGTQPNYEGQKITNIKINYADDTNRVIPFNWTDNSGIKEYNYSIYVDKEINSIEFLNAEGNFTYITKQYDFEIGKTYTITQRLRVD